MTVSKKDRVFALFFSILLLASLAPTASAKSTSTGPQECHSPSVTTWHGPLEDEDPVVAEVTRIGNSTIQVEYTIPSSATNFGMYLTDLDPIDVVQTNGFVRNGQDYDWDAESRVASAQFEFNPDRIENNNIESRHQVGEYIIGDNWMLFPIPNHYGQGVEFEFSQDGHAGSEYFYIGDVDKEPISHGCHDVTLIYPSNHELATSSDVYRGVLEDAMRELRIGGYPDHLTVFVFPSEGRSFYSGDAVVSGNETVTSARSALVHEYFHSRQQRAPDASTRWLVEASAKYGTARFMQHTGYTTTYQYDKEIQRWSTRQPTGILSDQSTWYGRSQLDYIRGALVLAAIDEAIRATSGGELNFFDVYRKINTGNGILNHSHLVEEFNSSESAYNQTWYNEMLGSDVFVEPSYQSTEAGHIGEFQIWWEHEWETNSDLRNGIGLPIILFGAYLIDSFVRGVRRVQDLRRS